MTVHDRTSTPEGVRSREEKDAPKAAPDCSATVLVQVGWINPKTGVMCDCPVYERSPHAGHEPVYREVK